MPCGWEGNRRFGVELAMRHRLRLAYPSTGYWDHGLRKGDEHPAYTHHWVWNILTFTLPYIRSPAPDPNPNLTINPKSHPRVRCSGHRCSQPMGEVGRVASNFGLRRDQVYSIPSNFCNWQSFFSLSSQSLMPITGVWGGAPSGVQGQSPWSGGQGGRSPP